MTNPHQLGDGAVSAVVQLVHDAEEHALRLQQASEMAIIERAARVDAESEARAQAARAEVIQQRETLLRMNADRKDLEAELLTQSEALTRSLAEDRAWELAADRDRAEADAQQLTVEWEQAVALARLASCARTDAENRIRELEALHAAEVTARQMAEERAWDIAADRDAERLARQRAEQRITELDAEAKIEATARETAETAAAALEQHSQDLQAARIHAESKIIHHAHLAGRDRLVRAEAEGIARRLEQHGRFDRLARLEAERLTHRAHASTVLASAPTTRPTSPAFLDPPLSPPPIAVPWSSPPQRSRAQLEVDADAWRLETSRRGHLYHRPLPGRYLDLTMGHRGR